MDAQTRREKQQREVDANYEAFEAMLSNLMAAHGGEYALMRNREVVGFYGTGWDAVRTGNRLFADGFFSVQKVSREVMELGALAQTECPALSAK